MVKMNCVACQGRRRFNSQSVADAASTRTDASSVGHDTAEACNYSAETRRISGVDEAELG